MKKNDGIEVEDGKEFESRTIVGGRPRRYRRIRLNVPTGIEKVLVKAAIDREFRTRLLEDRAAAVRASGFKLTGIESSVLDSIPRESLAATIESIQPEKHGKRRFMKAVASAVVTLATGTATIGCEENVKGVTADVPTDESAEVDSPDLIPEGLDADVPPDEPDEMDVEEGEADVPYDTDPTESWGISPDVPPDEPDE